MLREKGKKQREKAGDKSVRNEWDERDVIMWKIERRSDSVGDIFIAEVRG